MQNVSRETSSRLDVLCGMVAQWNPAINLVATSSMANISERHILDSAQLLDFCPPNPAVWVDIGSGGGFPGLVVAAILKERAENCRVVLIESDQRKCVFLQQAARKMDLAVTILNSRIEAAPIQNADVVSARALAPLPRLLPMANRHLQPDGTMLFLKGKAVAEELADAARAGWKFLAARHTSVSDPAGTVLVVRNIVFDPTE